MIVLWLQCLGGRYWQPDKVLCWRWTGFFYPKKVLMCSDWATELLISKFDLFCNFVSWIWWAVDSQKNHAVLNLVVSFELPSLLNPNIFSHDYTCTFWSFTMFPLEVWNSGIQLYFLIGKNVLNRHIPLWEGNKNMLTLICNS